MPTWSGMAFTAFVSDVFSRRIVGWRTAPSMPTELPLDALEMALWTRAGAGQAVAGLIHHSDAGTQYTSIRYSNRLADAGAVASIGTVGDCRQRPGRVRDRLVHGRVRPSRGPGPHRRRARAADPDLGPLVQPDPATQRPGTRPASRVRRRPQSSDQPARQPLPGELALH